MPLYTHTYTHREISHITKLLSTHSNRLIWIGIGFPGGSDGKGSSYNAGDWSSDPVLGRSLG